jgi:hypothetical protein
MTVSSKNPQVQQELDAWWSDPVNDMEKRHYTMALEFGLYGELIMERVVNQFTGRHRYNALDPLFVAGVVPHPKYPAVPSIINFWDGTGTGAGGRTIAAKIVNGVPEEALLSGAGMAGQEENPFVFYFRSNNLSGALRGHSNFYPLFEWADVLDNAGFTMGERMVIMLTYMWHLKSDNLDAETKKTYKKLLQEANPGAALITNKDVEFTAVSPDLKAADFTEGARFIRNLLSGAAGIPEHFMGEGGDVNRATAQAMNLPTLRSFLQQQREFVSVIRTLARANLVGVAAKGRIPMDQVDNFTVQADPMNPVDMNQTATAFSGVVSALSAAKSEGWVSDDEARKVIKSILGDVVEMEDDAAIADDLRTDLPEPVVAAMNRIKKAMGEEPDGIHVNGNGAAIS